MWNDIVKTLDKRSSAIAEGLHDALQALVSRILATTK